MPKLDWIGKQYVVNHTDEVPFRLLERIPEASVGEDSGNAVIHGDNLEALKALFPYYRERVKLVFIDPPYNTGNENWIYNDRMNAPKIKEWLGRVVGGEVRTGTAQPRYMETMKARHTGLSIPLMAVEANGEARELRYVAHLLGDGFNIDDLGFEPDGLGDSRAQEAKVDVDRDRLFVTEMSEAQNYGGNGAVEGDAADLTRWLLKKIGAYRELADRDLRRYIESALREVQKKHRPEELYSMKYQIRDRIQDSLNAHYLGWTERGYEEIKDKGDLTAEPGVAYCIPDEMELPRSQCTVSFQKSNFEFTGKLNAEELEFAGKLDALDNVACWCRNPDKDGFSLQGYWKARFNPDLIAFTKSGKIAVLEYKGEDRVTNEDSRYKESLGTDWASLDPESRYFKMVTRANMQSTLREIEEL